MFRPCIDVKNAQVVQLEQGDRLALTDERSPRQLAEIYAKDGLFGGHIIDLEGGKSKDVILAALGLENLQVGGGINIDNGSQFLNAGATHLIFSSAVFKSEGVDWPSLKELQNRFGRKRLVLAPDVRADREIWVQQWKKPTGIKLDRDLLGKLSEACDELLIHSIEVEGLEQGVDNELVDFLATHRLGPIVYAGGATTVAEVRDLHQMGLDVTIGKAYFSGKVSHEDLVKLNQELGR